MSIKGITDAQHYAPRLGKIHLGGKRYKGKDDQKGYPFQADYFIVPPEVQAIYGEKPKELTVLFMSNDLDQIMPHFYKLYGASTMSPICKGDGVTARRLDLKTGTRIECECPGPRECKFNHCIDEHGEAKVKECAPTMNLMINLPDVPGVGTYQIDTKSWNGLRELLNDVAGIKAALNGRLAFVPLTLRLVEREVDRQDPKRGQTKTRIRFMQLLFNGKIADLAKIPVSLVPVLPSGWPAVVPEPDETRPDEVVDGTAETETPQSVFSPATRDQLAAIEQLASAKSAEELAKFSIQGINVKVDPPVATVDGRQVTIDFSYASQLIHDLQDGNEPMDPREFAERFH